MTQEAGIPPKKTKDLAGGRGKDTLFRVASRNQIELIAIADNKANIIVGINVILISLIMAMFGSGFTINSVVFSKIELVLPFGILMLTCLVSAVLAILAARPRFISVKKQKEHSFLFFQNFYKLSLSEYLGEMHNLLKSRKAVYDQLIIDMYNNGLVLRRKYLMLSMSYTIFMVGIIMAVIVFGIASIF